MTNDKVVDLPCVTTLPIPPEKILRRALREGLSDVVVIGYDKEGGEYFASSEPDAAEVLYMLVRAQHRLMRTVDRLLEE